MHIALITTPVRIYEPNYIVPSGVLSIAAYLEQFEHKVTILDNAQNRVSSETIIEQLREINPDLIGISGIITAYAYIVTLSNDIKNQLPAIPIVLGGQVTINNSQNCFDKMGVDYLVFGYGEIVMKRLIDALMDQDSIDLIPGLGYKKDGAIVENQGRIFFKNLDELPLPAYHLIDIEHYATINGPSNPKLAEWAAKRGKEVTNTRFLTIMGALGCVAKCTFCIHEQEYVGLRYYSDEYILKHIKLLYDKYNIRVLGIGEEMFIANPKRAKRISEKLTKHFPDLYWRTATRANYITKKLLEIIDVEDSNCYSIGYGFESGSQPILDLMKKDTTREDNILAYKLLQHSRNLNGGCSFMIGNIGEDNKSINASISAIKEAQISHSAVFFTQPYPGGRIWDWAVEKGIIENTHEYLMHVSGKDAVGNLNVNLTPFPNWILHGWRRTVVAKLEQQARKKDPSRRKSIWSLQKAYFPAFKKLPTPLFILQSITHLYFLYYKITRKIFSFKKDKKYSFNTDEVGALLPKNLRKGQVPRVVSHE